MQKRKCEWSKLGILDIVRRLSGDGLSFRRSSGELRRWMTLAFSAERTFRFGSEAKVCV